MLSNTISLLNLNKKQKTSESQNETPDTGIHRLSTEIDKERNRTTSPSDRKTTHYVRSLHKNAMKALLLLSVPEKTSQASHYKMREEINIRAMKSAVRYTNVECLISKILKFGEHNLISNGIDIKSRLGQVGTSLEEIRSKKYKFIYPLQKYFNSSSSTNDLLNEIHVAKVEHNYKMVKETILKACEEIKNISSFDIQDRLKLSNFSETVTLDDESYHRCYDTSNSYVYYYENTKSISTEEPIAIIVTIITIFALLYFFAIITKMIKRNRKFR
ncbi:hypothetical protein [Candidatus Ichthyocystis sparus]|uniref:hypothetical protein n=1 Tax=Candidatus Ichthyocystis sparus TaxID=1561004 RepID=UPI000B88D2E5|nr:hypothetical protein [Candidatus Ichthyocystis sparus]